MAENKINTAEVHSPLCISDVKNDARAAELEKSFFREEKHHGTYNSFWHHGALIQVLYSDWKLGHFKSNNKRYLK